MPWEYWARFSRKPSQTHWKAAKRVLRYLNGTISVGLVYQGDSDVLGYSDSDWARDIKDRKSTSGYMLFQIANGPVSWKSKKQVTVSLSTAEAEYVTLLSAAQECVWIRRLNSEVGNTPNGLTTVLEDNHSHYCYGQKTTIFHSRTKHISIMHHFIREKQSS